VMADLVGKVTLSVFYGHGRGREGKGKRRK
jgi:hypothetical protein